MPTAPMHPAQSHALTGPQFAWRCIGAPDWPPPEPKKGDRYGSDPSCWLCGGPTDGVGWPNRGKPGIDPTSVLVGTAASDYGSQTVCQACVFVAQATGWAHLTGEENARLGWRNYSHLFTSAGHQRLMRADIRAVLLTPPEPPFLVCVAVSGQKQLMPRTAVADSRDVFPAQVEDERVWIDQQSFEAMLAGFEHLLNLGFSRNPIVSGEYIGPASGQVLKVGLRAWRAAEAEFAPYRERFPHYLTLCSMVAQRAETTESDTVSGLELPLVV